MKTIISILLLIGGNVSAQVTAVTKNPNTNEITGNLVMGQNRVLTFNPYSQLLLLGTMRTYGAWGEGKVYVNTPSSITFGSVDGMLTVTASGNHAIVARTPLQGDGIALVGWSSSGAPGAKIVQDTYFNSPTLTVWRDLSLGGGLTASPGLLLAATNGDAYSSGGYALEVKTDSGSQLQVNWSGELTARKLTSNGYAIITGSTVAYGPVSIYNSTFTFGRAYLGP